ncbi:MAG TPA: peptidylprolyl isomerase [Caulobacteraceae bacterium]|nr:peptidylprolyl isomerase [Caulobacteraceae bacterium]
MDSTTIGRRTLLAAGAAAVASAPHRARAAKALPKVTIHTARGVIVVELESGRAPLTSRNFLHYVDTKMYDDGQFYRASRTPGLPPGNGTIQGWPNPTIRRYPPIAHESTTQTGLIHDTGTISMGRFGPGSATADFFICASPQPYLDAHPDETPDPMHSNLGYAAFGHVISGMDVVLKILALPTNGKAFVKEMQGQILTKPVPILTMRRA